MNAIKSRASMFTAKGTSYLVVEAGLIKDMNGNSVSPTRSFERLEAEDYVVDSTDPTLVGFNIDMNERTLQLTFDETINKSSVLVTQITLQNNSDLGSSSNYKL